MEQTIERNIHTILAVALLMLLMMMAGILNASLDTRNEIRALQLQVITMARDIEVAKSLAVSDTQRLKADLIMLEARVAPAAALASAMVEKAARELKMENDRLKAMK